LEFYSTSRQVARPRRIPPMFLCESVRAFSGDEGLIGPDQLRFWAGWPCAGCNNGTAVPPRAPHACSGELPMHRRSHNRPTRNQSINASTAPSVIANALNNLNGISSGGRATVLEPFPEVRGRHGCSSAQALKRRLGSEPCRQRPPIIRSGVLRTRSLPLRGPCVVDGRCGVRVCAGGLPASPHAGPAGRRVSSWRVAGSVGFHPTGARPRPTGRRRGPLFSNTYRIRS